ncbi:MAG TPA: glutaredoxin 3 [Nevskiaceae bacterium]
MKRVLMFATLYCPYCMAARQLLKRKGVDFEEISVDDDPSLRQIMIQRSGRHTVPQIFIGDQAIGGYDELAALNRSGELDTLLNPS